MIGESMVDAAARTARQTLQKLLSNEVCAARATQAAAQLQKAHRTVVRTQENLLHALGFATPSDYQALARQTSRLKRRARRLRDVLEKRAQRRSLLSKPAAGAPRKMKTFENKN